MTPADYKHLRAWGWITGERPGNIELEQQRAANEGAPITALYKDHNGQWVTVEQTNNWTRHLVERRVKEMQR